MLNVAAYTSVDQNRVISFLKKAQPNIEPDMEILTKSMLIKDDEIVVGMVSYGKCGNLGVVRYFLYDACVAGTDLIVNLFFNLYKVAFANGINKLIAGVPNGPATGLFELLGFVKETDVLPLEIQSQLSSDTITMGISFDQIKM